MSEALSESNIEVYRSRCMEKLFSFVCNDGTSTATTSPFLSYYLPKKLNSFYFLNLLTERNAINLLKRRMSTKKSQ